MRPGWTTLAVVTLAAAAIAFPRAAVAETSDTTFDGGILTGLSVDPGFTQGSFQNLSYRHESCGTEPAEKTCIWKLWASLYSDPDHRCVPSTPESQPLADSGERSGNGVFESGPVSFALEGCRGQALSVHYEARKTFNPEEEEGPWKLLSSGSSGTLLWIVIGGEEHGEYATPTQWVPPANPLPSSPRPIEGQRQLPLTEDRQRPLLARLAKACLVSIVWADSTLRIGPEKPPRLPEQKTRANSQGSLCPPFISR